MGSRRAGAVGPDEPQVKLSAVNVGDSAVVVGVTPGISLLGRRLSDLGFLRGTEVRVVRRAPLGDPTVYELRGYQLCLRRTEARLIEVAGLGDASEGSVGGG